MKSSKLYLAMTVVGLIVPWWFLIGFITGDEVTPLLFVQSIFDNSVSSAVAADLLISALVFFIFVYREGIRLGMRHLWLFPVVTLGIGLSLGLPLFLYLHSRRMERGDD